MVDAHDGDYSTSSPVGKQSRTASETSACASTACTSTASSLALDDGFTELDNIGVGLDVRAFLPRWTNADVDQRYDVGKVALASGGSASVFIARDRQFSNRVLAVKKVTCTTHKSKIAIDNEIAIMKALDHPSICKLFEVYEEGNEVLLLMEYCEGGELFDLIASTGGITESQVADIVKQLGSALKHTHFRNICHRDIKPENVCFCRPRDASTDVKLIDWGLAARTSTGMTSPVGSVAYAAPEVLEAQCGKPYTSSCDLWSLGVITYVSLCGKPPFWGNRSQQLYRMKGEKYPLPDKAFSPHAKDFIRGLLKADPTMRTPLDDVMVHPFLQLADGIPLDKLVIQEVFSSLQRSSFFSRFFSICAACVARQLSHQNLQDLRRVFCELDRNGDGALDFAEVRSGFELIYGTDSQELHQIEEMFAKLDLDKSGTIDYTEFCAAGLGKTVGMQEQGLWSAFKAFDVEDDDERISEGELRHALASADVHHSLSHTLCEEVAREVIAKFDVNNDGSLDFSEFQNMMQPSQRRNTLGVLTSKAKAAKIPSL